MHCPPKWGGTDFLFPPISGRFLKFWGGTRGEHFPHLGGGGETEVFPPHRFGGGSPPSWGGERQVRGKWTEWGGTWGGNRGKNGVPPQDEGEISCSPPFVWFVPPHLGGEPQNWFPPKWGAPNLFPPKIRDLRNSGGETYPREISVGGK